MKQIAAAELSRLLRKQFEDLGLDKHGHTTCVRLSAALSSRRVYSCCGLVTTSAAGMSAASLLPTSIGCSS